MTKIRDIILYEKGKAPAAISNDELVLYLSPEYLRGKSSSVMVPRQSNFIQVSDSDIILLWDGSNAGEFFRGKKGVLASTMVRLVFSENTFDRNFLYHQFKYIEPKLKAKTSGSGIPHVDKQILGDFEILRISPSEQTRIADILSTVDAAIEQTEALVVKYERIKAGLMQDLLTRGIDEHGRIRSEATHAFKDSPLGRIPVEWKYCALGDVMTLQRGFDITEKQTADGKIPIISSSGITGYHNKFMAKGPGVITGRKGTLGKVYFIENPYWPHDTTLWVKDFKGSAPLFVYYLLMKLDLKKFDAATANPTLNRNYIHPLHIVFPSFVEEQKVIANKIQVFEKSADKRIQYLSKLKKLKKGLMQDLLSGKRRITMQPISEEIGEMVNATEL